MEFILIIVAIIILVVAIKFLHSRLSGKATLERYANRARAQIKTEEEIFKALMSCIIINGSEFESFEEIEEDLHSRDLSIIKLEASGFGDSLYKDLNEINQRETTVSVKSFPFLLDWMQLMDQAENRAEQWG